MSSQSNDVTARVLASLQEPTRSSFARILKNPASDAAALREAIQTYVATFQDHIGRSENLDHWTAQHVERLCTDLLDHFDDEGPEARSLIQAAVLYFVETADGEDDLRSLDGFEDDLDVVCAVARELGFESR